MQTAIPSESQEPHVVIVGGGFGGLYLAKALGGKPFRVTLMDKRNIHLFQPLLYQVATGGLSPGDIASPLRGVLRKYANVDVLMTEVTDVDPEHKRVFHSLGETRYDYLVLAAGCVNFYFGHDEWEEVAPGLKSVENALEMRRRILLAFESADVEFESVRRDAWLTFVVVGGGPTGVELAGAIAELARATLKKNFRHVDPAKARIVLLEAGKQILPYYPGSLAAHAEAALTRLGVEVRTSALVTEIKPDQVKVKEEHRITTIPCRTTLWAAGVAPSPLGARFAEKMGAELLKGKIRVRPDLSIPGYPEIFVIGDLAHVEDRAGRALPGVAPVAMQEGGYVAQALQDRLRGRPSEPFRYADKGLLAVIGRNRAVAKVWGIPMRGPTAWFIWALVHIHYLIEFDSKMLVLLQWAFDYITRKRGARLITGLPSAREIPPPAAAEQ